jgi:hypothetical protein
MSPHATSAEYLRARVEKIAEQVSGQLAKTTSGEQFFLVNDVVTAIENAVGDVVNLAQDAVNVFVNAAHDVVTAIEHVGERAIHAAEHHINDATLQTDFIIVATHQIINDAATEGMQLVGGPFVGCSGELLEAVMAIGNETKISSARAKASVAVLIQARRATILRQREALMNSTRAKRIEIKSRTASIRGRIVARSSSK